MGRPKMRIIMFCATLTRTDDLPALPEESTFRMCFSLRSILGVYSSCNQFFEENIARGKRRHGQIVKSLRPRREAYPRREKD